LAVAPVGSVLLAVVVGADLVAVEDFAAVVAGAGAAGFAAAAAGAAAAGAVAAVAAGAGVALVAFCSPPCPLQVPLPVDVVVVPSEQVLVAPVAAGAGVAGAAFVAGVAGAAVVFGAFCTPPWPLQVPLPVEVVVVPSLQVVVASCETLGPASANTINGAAMRPARIVVFMKFTPWFGADPRLDCKPKCAECDPLNAPVAPARRGSH
jgi:hypothetical protein